MRVLVAGATSLVGRRVVRALVAGGHEAVALTRAPGRAGALAADGAELVEADLLDPRTARRAVAEARPDALASLLIPLPRLGPTRVAHYREAVRMWERGVPGLLDAAVAAGAERIVAESVLFAYGYGRRGPTPLDESAPLEGGAALRGHARVLDALRAMEARVVAAGGMPLRYGVFHGPGVPMPATVERLLRLRVPVLPGRGRALLSYVTLDDAASATVAALERGQPGRAYNVVDDEPVRYADWAAELARALGAPRPRRAPARLARLVAPHVAVLLDRAEVPASNARARAELGWHPRHPTFREAMAAFAAERRG